MNREQFNKSLDSSQSPAGLNEYLSALWYDAKGNWEEAHKMIQDLSSPIAARIHGYLHRKEGDLGNAAYWYGRAGQAMPSISLAKEWDEILAKLLDQ
jgi:hypothetical protein